ncbi:MAG: hypothetical protein HRT47_05265 [Candidatus Caenarcaniphilales bacterium]|nr:hypothetical protein [Candidatus Caenarcaniphilales bacterium]
MVNTNYQAKAGTDLVKFATQTSADIYNADDDYNLAEQRILTHARGNEIREDLSLTIIEQESILEDVEDGSGITTIVDNYTPEEDQNLITYMNGVIGNMSQEEQQTYLINSLVYREFGEDSTFTDQRIDENGNTVLVYSNSNGEEINIVQTDSDPAAGFNQYSLFRQDGSTASIDFNSSNDFGVRIGEYGVLDDNGKRTTKVIMEDTLGIGTTQFHDDGTVTNQYLGADGYEYTQKMFSDGSSVTTRELADGSMDLFIANKHNTAYTLHNSKDEFAFEEFNLAQWDENGFLDYGTELDTEFQNSYGNLVDKTNQETYASELFHLLLERGGVQAEVMNLEADGDIRSQAYQVHIDQLSTLDNDIQTLLANLSS